MLSRVLIPAATTLVRTFRAHSATWLIVAIMSLSMIGAPFALFAASSGNSSAFGESVSLNLLPLLGNGVTVTSGPLPSRSGSAPPAFDLSQQVASVAVSSPLLGTVLQTGIIKAHAASTLPGQDGTSGDAEVNGLSLRLAGALPLLTLGADTIVSNAAVTGPCSSAPTVTGGSTFTNVVLGGTLGLGLTVPVHPAPNTVLLNLLGIRIVLNEQIATGSGLNRGLTVNALHVTLNNSILAGLGVLSGDITIAQSHADMLCDPSVVNPDMALTAFASPQVAHVGDAAQIEFEIDNLGATTATQVVFAGSITGAANIQSVVTSQGTCTGAATSSCSLGSIAAGGSATVTIHLQPTAVGQIAGSGTVSSSTPDPAPGDNQASASIDVQGSEGPTNADLVASATDSPDPVAANGTVTYTVIARNAGPQSAQGVVLSIVPPSQGTVLSVNTNRGSCSGTASIVCSIGTLTLNQTATVTVAVRAPVNGAIALSATVSSATTDPSPGNNQASQSTAVTAAPPAASADIALSATDSPDPVAANGTVTYTVTASNAGPQTAQGVAVSIAYPGQSALLSVNTNRGSCSGTAPIVCSIGALSLSQSATVTVVVQAPNSGTLTLSAAASSSTADPNSSNNQASQSTVVSVGTPIINADLSITVTDSPDPVAANATLTYQVTASNAGPQSAQGAILTISPPTGVALSSVIITRGTCTGTAPIRCTIGTIAANQSVRATVLVVAPASGALTIAAAASATTADPNPGNNQATQSTQVTPAAVSGADLAAVIVDTPDPVAALGTITYMVTASNSGPLAAQGVVLTISPPTRGRLGAVVITRGSCTGSAPIRCTIGGLAANQSVKATVLFVAPTQGEISMSASVTGTTADPNLANNQASSLTTITSAPPSAQAHLCAVENVPAATLLFPYFEVDLSNQTGTSTLISIVNTVSAGHLAHVTLWTDCGVPSMSFDVYLTGFDVQTIDVRDLFNGKVPQTGLGLSPQGELSDALAAPTGCPSQGTVAAGLNASQVAHIKAWHTGNRSPVSGNCASSPQANANIAFGYITVDAVKRCSSLNPATPGYFGANGVASNDNVLIGDYMVFDQSENTTKGDHAVHIVAEPGVFKAGDYTFYERYVNGSGIDNRRPLGTSYASRYMDGGPISTSTDLMIWRDTKVATRTGFACGTQPAWFPLEQRGVIAFDEEENAIELPLSNDRMPLGLQRVQMGSDDMPTPGALGWVFVDLWHKGGLFGNVSQGFVVTTMGTDGKYSLSTSAIRMDSACDKF